MHEEIGLLVIILKTDSDWSVGTSNQEEVHFAFAQSINDKELMSDHLSGLCW